MPGFTPASQLPPPTELAAAAEGSAAIQASYGGARRFPAAATTASMRSRRVAEIPWQSSTVRGTRSVHLGEDGIGASAPEIVISRSNGRGAPATVREVPSAAKVREMGNISGYNDRQANRQSL